MNRRRLRRLVMVVALAAATTVAAGTLASQSFAVVGGTAASLSDYPYFANLDIIHLRPDGTVYGHGLCGGSVIASGWVLTAAHCFLPKDDVPYASVRVFLSSRFEVDGTLTAVHPLFNGDTSDGHDLALVRVEESFKTAVPTIQVGAPADPAAYAPGTPATIMGYGRTSPGGGSGTFRTVNSELHSDDYMDDLFNKWYWFDYWPDSYVIGAGSSRRSACKGDSGGPLVVYRNDVPVQVGVASFAKDSCNAAAGFAELAGAQLAWLATVVPSIIPRWGFCDAGLGTVGRYVASYTTTAFPSAERDGPYYWGFGCEPYEPPVQG